MAKPEIKDPPKVDPPAPAPPEPTADMQSMLDMLTAIKGDTDKNAGILASLTAASSLPGKLDEMTEFIKANPGATVQDVTEALKKALTEQASQPEEQKTEGPGLADRIFSFLTFGQLDAKKKE